MSSEPNSQSCIRIWMRDSVPEKYRRFATFYDDGEIENTVFVAHVPAAVLADPAVRQCVDAWGEESYLWWQSRGPIGTNCMERFPDPGGDGLIVVGGWM